MMIGAMNCRSLIPFECAPGSVPEEVLLSRDAVEPRVAPAGTVVRLLRKPVGLAGSLTHPHPGSAAATLCLGLVLVFGAASLGWSAPLAGGPPNIVADDLGVGSVNCYHARTSLVRTPHMDRLAREGRRFTDANTPSSVCSPTRYAVLTGRYCWRTALKHEVLGVRDPLWIETNRLTVASLLKRHCYATNAIGKWHLGYGAAKPVDYTAKLRPGPQDLGFDYHFGVPSNHGDVTGVFVENEQVLGLRSTNVVPFGRCYYGGKPLLGIDAPHRETLATVATPAELADALASALDDQVTAQPSCHSQRAFYLLRSALMRTLRLPRGRVTPATALGRLIPWWKAGSTWAQLRDAVRARQWPLLVRPAWMSLPVHGLPLLAGAALVAGLPLPADWTFRWSNTLGFVLSVATGLRYLIVFPLVILTWVLLARLSRRFRYALPHNVRTVADLVPFVVTSTGMTWTCEQIRQQVREIVLTKLHVPGERYRPEARFVEDLGLKARLEAG